MFRRIITATFCLLTLSALCACSRYAVSINENIIYQPPPLFSSYSIADVTLKQCVQNTIAENNLTKAERVLRLICPPGEIKSLAGLEVFDNLEYLGLSGNKVSNIKVVENMLRLKQLKLGQNNVEDFSPAKRLSHLLVFDARGNKDANCASLPQPTTNADFRFPQHCILR